LLLPRLLVPPLLTLGIPALHVALVIALVVALAVARVVLVISLVIALIVLLFIALILGLLVVRRVTLAIVWVPSVLVLLIEPLGILWRTSKEICG
jgi:uncharacterized membrane protein